MATLNAARSAARRIPRTRNPLILTRTLYLLPSMSNRLTTLSATVPSSRPTSSPYIVACRRPFGVLTDDNVELAEQNLSIIELATSNSDPVEAQKELESLESHKNPMFPNVDSYSAVLNAWITNAHDQADDDDDNKLSSIMQANSILLRMSSSHHEPTLEDYTLVLNALAEIPHQRGVPQRAQLILELMEKAEHVMPTIETYNTVLDVWASGKEHFTGTRAQTLFNKLAYTNKKYNPNKYLKPNGDTYRTMIHAWAHSSEKKAAFHATGHLRNMLKLQRMEFKDMEPTMENYYEIFEAWKSAGDKNKAEKALAVLSLMEDAYMNRFSEQRADLRIFTSLLVTYSQSEHYELPLSGHVLQFLEKIWDRNLVPNTACFDAAIQFFRNAALHRNCNDSMSMATRAHRLLDEMNVAHLKSIIPVVVTTRQYNDVLAAYNAASGSSGTTQALHLIQSMEESPVDSLIRPNVESYTLALTIVANSQTFPSKVAAGRDLLDRARQEYRNSNNESANPTIALYNALIRACAASADNPGDSADKFSVALSTLDEIHQTEGVDADSETFQWLLEACESLLPSDNTTKMTALENVFTKCCESGMLSKAILNRFKALVPEELYKKLVTNAAKTDEYDGTRVLPHKWRQQSKAYNFSIDGTPVATAKARAKRTHRLRNRVGQKLLQGGRLTKEQMNEMVARESSNV